MPSMPNMSVGFDPHIPTGLKDASKRVKEAVPSLGTIVGLGVVLAFFGPYLLAAAGAVSVVATAYLTLFRKHTGQPYVPLRYGNA